MSKIAPQGKFNGFAVGDKLYTYEAGTTTPKTTYQDANLSAANTNPVIMDANAQADVWLGTGGYKFVLKDSNDVEYWTVDDISGVESAGFASQVISVSSALALNNTYDGSVIVCTNSFAVNLQAAATASNGFSVIIINRSAGNVTLDGLSAETINGAATYTILPNQSALLHCDGDEWFVSGSADVSLGGDNVFTGNNTFQGTIDVTDVLAETSAGGDLQTNGGVSCLAWGASGSANLTAGGNLSMGTTHKVVDMADPTNAQDAATKAYVDSLAISDTRVAIAWVAFNGTGTPSIQDSYNVSSITDLGTGAYEANLTSALPDYTHAAVVGGGTQVAGDAGRNNQISVAMKDNSTVSIETGYHTKDFDGARDWEQVYILVFGGNA